ncbi:MAG: tRNA (adenosine(37)-N6)-threonylcarbamoyltransferase complex dimerization subunit type 1 TsaB [Bacteroidetes bacterium]|nr:tRNA (adenosine(37)-N6)-threonylcarbamoyltransferase complex dimerization subunit type 1 TsaB [Bacteroidota bacterium]
MAKILNIETSTNVCSVALSENGKLIDYKESQVDKSHSTILTVFIDEMLKQNNIQASQLDAVAVSKGPGSYTGLRIGVSVTKGICYAVEKPAIGVSTLQLMALGVVNSNKFNSLNIDDIKKAWFCPMIDARRMEVYSAFFDFENNQQIKVSADIIDENSYKDLLDKRKIVFFGDGANKCKDIINDKNAFFIDDIYPSAKNMIALSYQAFLDKEFEDTAYFEPFYLKDFVATVSKKNIFK